MKRVSFDGHGSLEPHISIPWIFFFRSDEYDVFDSPPMVLPVRGHLDAVRRLLKVTSTSGADADNVAFVAVSMPTITRCWSSAVRPQLSGSLRSSLWTPNFREISTLSLERDCFATAGRRKHATLIRSSQLSATSSRKPSR